LLGSRAHEPVKDPEFGGGGVVPQGVFTFEPGGEVIPVFQRHRVAVRLDPQTRQQSLKAADRDPRPDGWSPKLNATNFQQFAYARGNSPVRWPCQVVGHMAVMQVGHTVFGFDVLGKQVLWEKSLLGTQGDPGQPIQINYDPREGGTIVVLYQKGWRQRLGQTGAVEASHVCIQTRDALVVIDPVSGRTLWTRTEMPPYYRVFGDEDHIY